MQLTPHFTLAEFEASETAARKGIVNEVPDDLLGAVKRTAEGLERVRALLGKPVIILSGYRCPELNQAVGGAARSQHMFGLAADIIVPRFGTPMDVCSAIFESDISFDQLILEYRRWTHISFVGENGRRQILTIDHHFTKPGLWA